MPLLDGPDSSDNQDTRPLVINGQRPTALKRPDLADSPNVVPASDDLALLRRFEPILCFTKGELFFPMDVDRYLASARLCVHRPEEGAEVLVPPGELNAERLASSAQLDTPELVVFLSVADPVSADVVHAFRRTSSLKDFHAGPGRLARVGLPARFVDLLFSLSLLLRGKAPGGLATGSAQWYQATQAQGERYCYYGRVVRVHGYIALQYWFFYAYNDWRSSFHGVNNHEADWEMVTVYAAEDGRSTVLPYWLACSAHDSEGDDLRRRWDDPSLERLGEHPIIYPGAGSHANYFFQGEYLPAVIVPYTQGLARAWLAVRRAWARLGQGSEPDVGEGSGFRIPFVDYARGDGRRVGPQQQRTWDPRLLQATASTPAPFWVEGYAGLWGRYSGDPRGENPPPGPRYEPNGLQRRRWYDPVGWSGLDKVPPPTATLATIAEQQLRLRAEQDEIAGRIEEQTSLLTGLEMEAMAMRGVPAERSRNTELQRHIREVGAELKRLKAEDAGNELAQMRCKTLAERVQAGDVGDPRAHLHHPPLPSSPVVLRLGKLAAIWSSISVGLLLLGFAALSRFSGYLAPGILILLGAYAFFEVIFQREVQLWVSRLVVALALVTTLLLLMQYIRPVVLVAVVAAGLLIIVENLREVLG